MGTSLLNWPSRTKAAGIHLILSAVVGAIAAAVIFGLWYPWPYRAISGGQSLFWLLVSVDVTLGPLLTLAVFNVRKPRAELVRDLLVIGCLQLAALGYGSWVLFEARPVHLVFEVSRFRVVTAIDIDPAELGEAPADLRRLPLLGPTLISTREPTDQDEKLRAIDEALQGRDLSMKPRYWIPYSASRSDVLRIAQPLLTHVQKKPAQQEALQRAAERSGRPAESLRVLPLLSRTASWTVLIDSEGDPVGYLDLDL